MSMVPLIDIITVVNKKNYIYFIRFYFTGYYSVHVVWINVSCWKVYEPIFFFLLVIFFFMVCTKATEHDSPACLSIFLKPPEFPQLLKFFQQIYIFFIFYFISLIFTLSCCYNLSVPTSPCSI